MLGYALAGYAWTRRAPWFKMRGLGGLAERL